MIEFYNGFLGIYLKKKCLKIIQMDFNSFHFIFSGEFDDVVKKIERWVFERKNKEYNL